MATAAFLHVPPPNLTIPFKLGRSVSPQSLFFPKRLLCAPFHASTSLDYSAPSKSKTNSGSWRWKLDGNSVNIHFKKVEKDGGDADQPRKDILMVPTISDVSTVEEWRGVAEEIVGKSGSGINWSATIVDWPGLGYSDRPKLDYNADVMEGFLVDFVNAPDSPISDFVAGFC